MLEFHLHDVAFLIWDDFLIPHSSCKTHESIFFWIFAATSFVPHHGERGQVIVATKPKILFCDLCLFPGESKSCEFLNLYLFLICVYSLGAQLMKAFKCHLWKDLIALFENCVEHCEYSLIPGYCIRGRNGLIACLSQWFRPSIFLQ